MDFHTMKRSRSTKSLSPPQIICLKYIINPAAELEEMEKNYAAYVCHPVYGPIGRGPVSVTETLLLGLAMVTLIRVLAMTVLVICYLICRVCTLFSAPNWEGKQQEDYTHLSENTKEILIVFVISYPPLCRGGGSGALHRRRHGDPGVGAWNATV